MSFGCFEAFFVEIHRELLFLDRKLAIISETAMKYSESLFFLPCLKGKNSEEKFGFV